MMIASGGALLPVSSKYYRSSNTVQPLNPAPDKDRRLITGTSALERAVAASVSSSVIHHLWPGDVFQAYMFQTLINRFRLASVAACSQTLLENITIRYRCVQLLQPI